MAHKKKKPGPKKKTAAKPSGSGNEGVPVDDGPAASTPASSEAGSSTRAPADLEADSSQVQSNATNGTAPTLAQKPLRTYMKKGRQGQSIATVDATAVERAREDILSAIEGTSLSAAVVQTSNDSARALPVRASQRQAALRQSSAQGPPNHQVLSDPSDTEDISLPPAGSQSKLSSSLRIVIPAPTQPSHPSPEHESLPPTPVDDGDADHLARHETARALAALQEEYTQMAEALRARRPLPQQLNLSSVDDTELREGRSSPSAQATKASSPLPSSPIDEDIDPVDPPTDNPPPEYDPYSHPFFDIETDEEFWEADGDGDCFYKFQANGCTITYRGEAPALAGRGWSAVEHYTVFRGPNNEEYRPIPGGYRVPRYSINQRRDARIEWVLRHGFPDDIIEDDGDSDDDYEQSQRALEERGLATDADLEADTDIDATPKQVRGFTSGLPVIPPLRNAPDHSPSVGAPPNTNLPPPDEGRGRAAPAIPLPRTSRNLTRTSPNTNLPPLDKGKGRAVPAIPLPRSAPDRGQPVGAPPNTNLPPLDKGKGRATPAIPLPRSALDHGQPVVAPPNTNLPLLDKGKGRATPAIPLPRTALDHGQPVDAPPNTNLLPCTVPDRFTADGSDDQIPNIKSMKTLKTTKPTLVEMANAQKFGNWLVGKIRDFASESQRSPELVMTMAGLPLNLDVKVGSGWNNFQQLYAYKTPGVPHDEQWHETCRLLYKEKVQSLPPDERKVAEVAIESSLLELATDPAIAKSPSARMDIMINELERRSHTERLSPDIVAFHFAIYIGDDDGARHKNSVVASHPLAPNILARAPYSVKKIVAMLTDASRIALIDEDCKDTVKTSDPGSSSSGSHNTGVNEDCISANRAEDPRDIIRRSLTSSNNSDRYRKAVISQWLAQLCALTGLKRGNFPSSRFGVFGLDHHLRMVNFPDNDRLKAHCPGRCSSRKPQPVYFWQTIAETWLQPNVEPPCLELWTEEEENLIIHSEEWNAIPLVVTTSGEVLLTAGDAHQSQSRSTNRESADDTPTDDEDSGEIHYFPPDEFEGYQLVNEHQDNAGHPGTTHSESPEIRLHRKRVLDEIVEYDEQEGVQDEIGEFSIDDITPRPARPLPPRSPYIRRATSIPPAQPHFAPMAAPTHRQEGQIEQSGVMVKRRRVAFTDDEARDAQRRLEAVAARGHNLPRRHPVVDSSQLAAPVSRFAYPATSLLPPYTIEAPPARPAKPPRRSRLDIPSSLTPELFEEARRMKTAKQALLDQQRSMTGQSNILPIHRRSAAVSIASGSHHTHVHHPVASTSQQVYPAVASGSQQRHASHPAASVDVFYSPTKALPPSRRLPTGQSVAKSTIQLRQEPVAGPSSTVHQKNGAMKGRYPPLM